VDVLSKCNIKKEINQELKFASNNGWDFLLFSFFLFFFYFNTASLLPEMAGKKIAIEKVCG
jgi:hypothetical protein